MEASRLWIAASLGLGVVAACATSTSPLARQGDESSAGAAGSAGASGAAGSAGGAGSTAGASGASGAAGAAGSAGGATGSAGAAGSAGASGMSGASGQAGAADGGAGAPPVVDEPDGPAEFRILNGVTNVGAVKLCLLPWGGNEPLGVEASPQPAAGLPYGSYISPKIPDGVDPSATALRPYVLSGDLGVVEGKGCLGLVSEPPESVQVSPLPVLPAGTLTAPRSRLLGLAGCIGGVPTADPLNMCGVGVDPQVGNLSVILVELSRIAPPAGRLGLQVVHASTALPALRVQTAPSQQGTPVIVASPVALGQVTPRPPYSNEVGTLFGITLPSAAIKLFDSSMGTELMAFDVISTLLASGLTEADVAPDRGLVMVALGPRPGSVVDAAPVTATRLLWLPAPAPAAP